MDTNTVNDILSKLRQIDEAISQLKSILATMINPCTRNSY